MSWDVSGIYTVNPEVNMYARVARSFRAPSFQGRVLFGDVVTIAGDVELAFEPRWGEIAT